MASHDSQSSGRTDAPPTNGQNAVSFFRSSRREAEESGALDSQAPAIVRDDSSKETSSEPKNLYCAGEVRVLVVDDDEAIGEVIQAALEPNGFQVDVISVPRDLEEQLYSQQYHLIILDYVLPGLKTEQVLDWIQISQQDASIIVVTAYPSMDSALNCLRAHTYDYIPKPFSLQLLVDRVTRCLESRGLLRLSEEALRESVGSAIRERRKAMGLTLAQMADRTGISLGYLSQIELGKNSASVETLYRISLGLGVRLSELFQTLQLDI